LAGADAIISSSYQVCVSEFILLLLPLKYVNLLV